MSNMDDTSKYFYDSDLNDFGKISKLDTIKNLIEFEIYGKTFYMVLSEFLSEENSPSITFLTEKEYLFKRLQLS